MCAEFGWNHFYFNIRTNIFTSNIIKFQIIQKILGLERFIWPPPPKKKKKRWEKTAKLDFFDFFLFFHLTLLLCLLKLFLVKTHFFAQIFQKTEMFWNFTTVFIAEIFSNKTSGKNQPLVLLLKIFSNKNSGEISKHFCFLKILSKKVRFHQEKFQ